MKKVWVKIRLARGISSTGNITDEIQQYLDHHKDNPNSDQKMGLIKHFS